jgi:hypothetical protein
MATERTQTLHELLAVEGQLKGQAESTRKELSATFDKKPHLFQEKVVTFTPAAEEGGQEQREQQSTIQTTVKEELAWITNLWSKALDTSVNVQRTCQVARADVELDDGTIIMRDMPVLALLELEKRAGEMQELVKTVPTLDPAKGFTPDKDRGNGIYASREVKKSRTKKDQRPIVLYPHSPEHPAQTQLITVDVSVGTITEREWSGMITPAEKADMIARAEELQRAIKKARMRANSTATQAPKQHGADLLTYVFKGEKKAV